MTHCVCDRIVPLAVKTKVVVLQHPQEQDRELGTARLLTLSLGEQAALHIGLSWGSLALALKPMIATGAWGVLHLGQLPRPLTPQEETEPLVILSKRGERLPNNGLEGIILLDGSWSQAKALWWRNAWLLKLPRVIVHAKDPSLYGKMRKEPRKECLSTLEAAGETLTALGEPPEVSAGLKRLFRTLLQRARDAPSPKV